MASNNDKIPELSKKEFDSFIEKDLVLIEFSADWCMPCIMMAPIMEDLAYKLKGKIKFGKVNIDDNSDIAQKFNVVSIPHFVLFKEGKKIGEMLGSIASEDLEKKIGEFV
jgi:thioredoxin 1|tara:strand:- start:340 stop:669 length:330 start_codon:yes stop_codon:yes gene_type:complete